MGLAEPQVAPKRVAVVIPVHWNWRLGGSQIQARHLIAALWRNHSAVVRYFAARVSQPTDFEDHDIEIVTRHEDLHRYGHFWDYFRLQKALAEFRPDVIYQRIGCAYTGIAAQFARRTGTPMVWHLASDKDCQVKSLSWGKLLRPHKAVEDYLASQGPKHADVIVAQTYDQADLLERNYGRRPDLVVRNFQPMPAEASKDNSRFRVVWVANLKPVKRPDEFLKLAEAISDVSNVEFTMIGAPYMDKVKQTRFEDLLYRCKNVQYLGSLPEARVLDEMRRANLLVNTSVREGFSNTFIQAWMCGMPVMTLGINPDGLLDKEWLGFCCASVQDMAHKMRQLAGSLDELKQTGVRCRKYADRHFSMSNCDKLAAHLIDIATGAAGYNIRTEARVT
jgi:glycosyltransferase involved in cell wall biosynthesis